MKTALLLLACVGLGLFGAHSFIEKRRSIQEITAPADVAEVQTEAAPPADIPVDPFGGSEAQKEFDEITKRAEMAEAEVARLTGVCAQWQAEAKKFQDNLAVIGEDRDLWQKETVRLDAMTQTLTEQRDQWQTVALKNKSVAEQNAAIAQQNAAVATQWQAAAKQPPPVPWSAFDKFDQRRAAIDAARAAKAGASTSAAARARLDQMTRDSMASDAAVTQERQLNNIARELRLSR